ncbi:MAG: PAS domain-containing protein [Planctomycetota bacterium]
MPRFDETQAFQTSATYRALANSLPLSLLIKSVDGRRVFANHAYLRWRGVQWQDVIGKCDADLFSPEQAAIYTADDRKVMETGQSLHNIESSRRPDGSDGWIERVKSPIDDHRGHRLGVQVLFWDVTDRVVAERTSQYEQSLLTTLLKNLPDSIYFKDLDSRFVRVSEAMVRKFGLTSVDELYGRTDADIFTPEHASAARQDELQIIQSGKPLVDRVERETWDDQDDTWCLSTKMPLRDADGRTIGTFGISRDITELKHSEAALQAAVRRADAANQAKSEFLANMSHEIRTPINAMVGMAELLEQTSLDDAQQDHVRVIRESSATLLRLINDILDFSKIEARRMTLERVSFSIAAVANRALNALRWKAEEKGLHVRLEIDPELPPRLIGDPGRLQQVLVNLLSNAIKFTDEGRVSLEISPGEASGDATRCGVRFAVSDTGIGISESQQNQVLRAFTQADTSMTRRFGGTGLGLSISRQLVELMGGQLQLSSEIGVGTTFSFDLTMAIAAELSSALSDEHRDDERDLVGTNPDSHLGVEVGSKDQLPNAETGGLRILVAEDGLTNQHVISGLLQSLRHQCSIASDGRETIAQWELGSFDLILMDMHMPVMDGLEATRIIRRRECDTGQHIPIIALTAAAMREDAIACREAGMDDYLTKPILRRQLRATLDKHANKTDRSFPRVSGKPDRPGPVRVIVDESQTSVGSARDKTHPMMSDSSTSLQLSRVHADCLDLDMARSRIPGGAAGVLRLAGVFHDECCELIQQMSEQHAQADWKSLGRTAHTLKGACGLLGARRLQVVASRIESAVKTETIDEIDSLWDDLKSQSDRVLDAVNELRQRSTKG